jgi:hypothetical protein
MKNLLSFLALIIVLFVIPGIGLYFAFNSNHPVLYFLSFFTLSVTLHLTLGKKLGWKIDEQIRKNHSW